MSLESTVENTSPCLKKTPTLVLVDDESSLLKVHTFQYTRAVPGIVIHAYDAPPARADYARFLETGNVVCIFDNDLGRHGESARRMIADALEAGIGPSHLFVYSGLASTRMDERGVTWYRKPNDRVELFERVKELLTSEQR